jgi:uncharacterized membrane protein
MEYLESVQVIDRERSRWTLATPISPLTWEAEIYREQQDELISWRSMPDSTITHAGTIRFEESTGGRGTRVSLTISYSPPLGAVGGAVAKLLPQEPGRVSADALRKFKQLMETGEIATSRVRRDAMSNQLQATAASNGRSY